MQTTTVDIRRTLGCGFEPPLDGAVPWQPPSGPLGFQGGRLKICAGYTTNLPEVLEVVTARVHWKHGELRSFCGERKPTEETMHRILVLENAYNGLSNWRSTPKKNGGGLE
jgi:hypothetical protein